MKIRYTVFEKAKESIVKIMFSFAFFSLNGVLFLSMGMGWLEID